MNSNQDIDRSIPASAMAYFVAITFAITWGLVGLYVLFPDQATSILGEISGSHPVFFLATWAPSIAAFILVGLYGGLAGLKGFLSRLLLWRTRAFWIVFLLVVVPLVFAAGSSMKGGPLLAPLPPEGVAPVIGALVMMLFLGPLEEFGWRGFAQPLLQRSIAPIWAGVLIGVVWGVWHLPAFYLSGVVHSGWNFLPFFFGSVLLAVIVTPMFNDSKGSILWPLLLHWQLNNPFWPDAQPYDTWVMAGVAAAIVWWKRDTMFGSGNAVTRVIPDGR
jgi:membrane protease YdiL (CAAX protease family)